MEILDPGSGTPNEPRLPQLIFSDLDAAIMKADTGSILILFLCTVASSSSLRCKQNATREGKSDLPSSAELPSYVAS